jgi:two-component system, sensor histidine kinase and response regulator
MLENTLDPREATRTQPASLDAIFDAAAAIERLDGDEDLFQSLVEIFQQDSVELYKQLSAGVASGNLSQAARAAHSLKGLAANFNAKEAIEAAFRVEELTRSGAVGSLELPIEKLGEKLEELRRALANWTVN